MRPIYAVSLLPALTLAGWWQRQHGGPRWAGRWAALVLGAALVLAPQLLINEQQFGRATPLVLAQFPGQPIPLYLLQLCWGVRVQLYATALRGCLIYADPAGVQLLRGLHIPLFGDYAGFLRVVMAHPVAFALRYARHLFNGLDVQYAAPFIRQLGGAEPWLLRLLNYPLLAVGLWMGGRGLWHWRKWPRRGAGLVVGAALLLPVLVALPTAVEGRFFLPLHALLLVAAVRCFAPLPAWHWLRRRPRRRLAVAVAAGLWLAGCWALSLSTAQALCGPAGTGSELVERSLDAPIP